MPYAARYPTGLREGPQPRDRPEQAAEHEREQAQRLDRVALRVVALVRDLLGQDVDDPEQDDDDARDHEDHEQREPVGRGVEQVAGQEGRPGRGGGEQRRRTSRRAPAGRSAPGASRAAVSTISSDEAGTGVLRERASCVLRKVGRNPTKVGFSGRFRALAFRRTLARGAIVLSGLRRPPPDTSSGRGRSDRRAPGPRGMANPRRSSMMQIVSNAVTRRPVGRPPR